MKKHFQTYLLLLRVRIIAETTQRQTSLRFEGGCTSNYVSNNDADDSVQPYEGKPLADEEWMCRHYKKRTAKEERLEVRRSRLERSETVDNDIY